MPALAKRVQLSPFWLLGCIPFPQKRGGSFCRCRGTNRRPAPTNTANSAPSGQSQTLKRPPCPCRLVTPQSATASSKDDWRCARAGVNLTETLPSHQINWQKSGRKFCPVTRRSIRDGIKLHALVQGPATIKAAPFSEATRLFRTTAALFNRVVY